LSLECRPRDIDRRERWGVVAKGEVGKPFGGVPHGLEIRSQEVQPPSSVLSRLQELGSHALEQADEHDGDAGGPEPGSKVQSCSDEREHAEGEQVGQLDDGGQENPREHGRPPDASGPPWEQRPTGDHGV
jgi:hypothetical protein